MLDRLPTVPLLRRGDLHVLLDPSMSPERVFGSPDPFRCPGVSVLHIGSAPCAIPGRARPYSVTSEPPRHQPCALSCPVARRTPATSTTSIVSARCGWTRVIK